MGILSSLTGSSNKANCKKIKEDGCVVTLAAEIPWAEFESELHNSLIRLQSEVRMPGFRAGKAPLPLIEKQFAEEARRETRERLVVKHARQFFKDLSIDPVAASRIDDMVATPGQPLKFKLQVEVAPNWKAKDYLKIPVQKKLYPPTTEEIDRRLDELREAHARLETAKAAKVEKGHYAVIDYSISRDGKPLKGGQGQSQLIDMSSPEALPGLLEGLTGMEREQTKEFKVQVEGRDALMAAILKEIKEKILPPADEELAKDMGLASLAELKSKLKEVMEAEGRNKTEQEMDQQIQAALLKSNPMPLPPTLVKERQERLLERLRERLLGPEGRWPEKELKEIGSKVEEQAKSQLRIEYVLASIAAQEKLDVSEDELKAELERSLAQARGEEQKQEARQLFEERRDYVAGLMRERKAFALVREKAAITQAS